MKICVVTSRYSLTGVALAQTRFAQALAKAGHEVDLIFGFIDEEQLPPGRRELPQVLDVSTSNWGQPQVRGMFRPLCRYLKEVEPDVVFSAEDHLNDVVLLSAIVTRSKAKISGSSRVLPIDAVGHDGPYSNRPFTRKWLFKLFTRAVMWRADALTCVSEDMVTAYRKLFKNSPHVCVHNIIVDEHSRQRMREPVNHLWFSNSDIPVIVSAGTLTKRKGFVDLIRAVAHLIERGRQVRLAILGTGPMREELESLVQTLGIQNFVWFTGLVENPLRYFARARVSVLASYSEGLPNVLVEAMMCGCVPVATDCPTGPREVLQGGKYGYLVPMHDPVAMADAIEMAFDNPIESTKLEEAIKSFRPEAVIRRHFELLGCDPSSQMGRS